MSTYVVAREVEFQQINAGLKGRNVGQVAVGEIANDESGASSDGHFCDSVNRTSEQRYSLNLLQLERVPIVNLQVNRRQDVNIPRKNEYAKATCISFMSSSSSALRNPFFFAATTASLSLFSALIEN